MTAENLFRIANLIILLPWALLAAAPAWQWTQRIAAIFVPLLLAVAYFCIFIREIPNSSGGFGTLQGVMWLFENPWIVLAGWLHYLAFDLFVGAWEVRDARRLGISQLAILPFLILTMMLGPVGFAGYFLLRYSLKREVEP